MDDGDGRAPVALAAEAPIAQTPGGFLIAQAFGGQQLGHFVGRGFLVQTIEFARVHAHAGFGGVPLLPSRHIKRGQGRIRRCAAKRYHLLNWQVVFQSKFKVTLVMRRNAHHSAVAIRHQHIVAHPNLDLGTRQRVGDKETRRHAFFLLRRQLCLGRAATFAFFNESRQGRLRRRRMHC